MAGGRTRAVFCAWHTYRQCGARCSWQAEHIQGRVHEEEVRVVPKAVRLNCASVDIVGEAPHSHRAEPASLCHLETL